MPVKNYTNLDEYSAGLQAEAPKIFGAQGFAPGATKRWSGAAPLIVMQARNMNRLNKAVAK